MGPYPKIRGSRGFEIVEDNLGNKTIRHQCNFYCYYVTIDFPGSCSHCGKNYAFEVLKNSLEGV